MSRLFRKYIPALFIFLLPALSVFAQTEKEYLEKIKNASDDSARVVLYIKLSDKFTYSNPDKALNYLDKAYGIIKKSGKNLDFQLAKYYNNKGIIKSVKGHYYPSIENYQKALEILYDLQKKEPEDRDYYSQQIAIISTNIGVIYYHLEKYHKAIDYYRKSIPYFQEPDNASWLGQVINNIGVCYLALKKYDSAGYYYNKALDIFKNENSEKNISMAYNNLGEIYTKKGNFDRAVEYFKKAITIKEKIKDKYGLASCYNSLSRLYYEQGNYSQSKKTALKAVQFSKDIDDLKELRDAYEILAKSNKALHRPEEAYNYYVKFKETNDSILNVETNNKILELQTKYETEKKENELKLIKQKEETRIIIEKVLISGIVLIIIISFLIIRAIVIKRKNEKRLYEANSRLKEQEAELIRQKLEKQKLLAKELSTEIDYKSKQLTTHALNIMQKNKMLQGLLKDINDISTQAKPEVRQELRKLKNIVKNNIKNEKEWETFRLYFEEVNKGFYDKLIAKCPSLNAHDLRHCALIKLNLSVKEAASVLNLSPNSVKSARYRIKKKLGLDPEDDLYEVIRDLG